jgi:hypothetical protein
MTFATVIVAQLVEHFPSFHSIRSFITFFPSNPDKFNQQPPFYSFQIYLSIILISMPRFFKLSLHYFTGFRPTTKIMYTCSFSFLRAIFSTHQILIYLVTLIMFGTDYES